MPISKRRRVEVRVTRELRDHSGTHWHLYSVQPDKEAALVSCGVALSDGFAFAKIVETTTLSRTGD